MLDCLEYHLRGDNLSWLPFTESPRLIGQALSPPSGNRIRLGWITTILPPSGKGYGYVTASEYSGGNFQIRANSRSRTGLDQLCRLSRNRSVKSAL